MEIALTLTPTNGLELCECDWVIKQEDIPILLTVHTLSLL